MRCNGCWSSITARCARVVAGLEKAWRGRIEPEDVLQETYVSAFRALARSHPCSQPVGNESRARAQKTSGLGFDDPRAFYKWLECIALRELRDAKRGCRRKKRDIRREVGRPGPCDLGTTCTDLVQRVHDTGTSPSRAFSRQEAVAAVLTALARLSEEQRAVVRWRFVEDVPVAEIADRLGKPEEKMLTSSNLRRTRRITPAGSVEATADPNDEVTVARSVAVAGFDAQRARMRSARLGPSTYSIAM